MERLKHYVAIILAVLVTLFAVQNMAVVNVDFLFWRLSAPRAVVLLIVFLLGVLVGTLFARRVPR